MRPENHSDDVLQPEVADIALSPRGDRERVWEIERRGAACMAIRGGPKGACVCQGLVLVSVEDVPRQVHVLPGGRAALGYVVEFDTPDGPQPVLLEWFSRVQLRTWRTADGRAHVVATVGTPDDARVALVDQQDIVIAIVRAAPGIVSQVPALYPGCVGVLVPEDRKAHVDLGDYYDREAGLFYRLDENGEQVRLAHGLGIDTAALDREGLTRELARVLAREGARP